MGNLRLLAVGFAIVVAAGVIPLSAQTVPLPGGEPDAGIRLPAVQWVPNDVQHVAQANRGLVTTLPATEGPQLTLADLEAIAFKRNPTLVQAAMQVEAMRGTYLQAGLYPNPVVGYLGEDIGIDGSAGQQGAFVEQEIVTAGKRQLRRNVAGHGVEQAQHASETQRLRVLTDVRAGYFDVLVTQHMAEVNDELLRIEEEGTRTTTQLLEAKEASRVNLLQSKVETETARIRLQAARNRHQGAWRQLAALLGAPEMALPKLAGTPDDNLPALDWDETLKRLLSTSPELAQARAGVQRAQCEVASQCAERVPNVTLLSGVRYDTAVEDTIATVQVGLPLPIYNRNQGKIYQAQSQLTATQNEVDRLELLLYNRLAAAFEEYETARYQVDRYMGNVIPQARESLELVTAGYRQGELSYLELLTAQRTFANVTLQYLDSLQQLRSKSVAIGGLLLSGGLQSATGTVQ